MTQTTQRPGLRRVATRLPGRCTTQQVGACCETDPNREERTALMSVASTTTAASTRDVSSISPVRLWDAPLPVLLAECDAELVDPGIPDSEFFGAVVRRQDGHILLAMPAGRPEWEHDTVARGLLGNILGVDTAPLPAPLFETVAIS